MQIEKNDILAFQQVVERAAALSFKPNDLEIEAPSIYDAQLFASIAKGWARVRGSEGHISIGEDTDARLTAIKSNLLTEDWESAVLGVIGLLQARIEQLTVEHNEFSADFRFVHIANNMGLNELSETSSVRMLFDKYRSLLYEQQD